jgi:sugar phosphate isomerase/epimerase
MKLLASQRLWSPAEEAAVLPRLQSWGVDGVAVLFPRLGEEEGVLRRATRCVADWARLGLQTPVLLDPIDGTHGALWGDGSESVFKRFHVALEAAAALGAETVVLSAPSLRRGPLPVFPSRERDTLLLRMQALGDRAAALGVFVSIKPVPSTSGGVFWRNVEEIIAFIQEAEAQAMRPFLDAGGLSREENPRATLGTYAGVSVAFGANEAFGGPLRERGGARHRLWATDLARLGVYGRAPDWLVWDADGPSKPRDPVDALAAQAQVVRALYGVVLQTPPVGDGVA